MINKLRFKNSLGETIQCEITSKEVIFSKRISEENLIYKLKYLGKSIVLEKREINNLIHLTWKLDSEIKEDIQVVLYSVLNGKVYWTTDSIKISVLKENKKEQEEIKSESKLTKDFIALYLSGEIR